MGVMSSLSSPLCLLFITVGLVRIVQAQVLRPKYFTAAFQLFPTWPRFDAERMLWLFVFTMATLLLPKVIGLLRAMCLREPVRSFGALLGLLLGWVVGLVVSAVLAPVFLLSPSRHFGELFTSPPPPP